ncbi:MAG: fluoride efflux transporter CrcB [Phycisphaerae bacterium]|nr:fluoride efflux transporter CrcB [Phycisphaerae bacterium]
MYAYKLLLLAAGGAVGTVARYLTTGLAQRIAGSQFPAGTLAVNLLGCLVIGWLFGLMDGGRTIMRDEFRLMITVGVLGGFTTFSSFGWETISLIHDGQWFRAGLNVLLNNVVGLALVFAGFKFGQLAHAW